MNYDADFLEGYIDPDHSDRVDNENVSDLAKIAKEQHSQLKEALSIIKDLTDLHDKHNGCLTNGRMYNDPVLMSIIERIDVLRLSQ